MLKDGSFSRGGDGGARTKGSSTIINVLAREKGRNIYRETENGSNCCVSRCAHPICLGTGTVIPSPIPQFFSTGHIRPEKSEPSGNAPLVYRGQWFYMCIIGPKRSQDGCVRIQTLFDTRELSLTMATRSSREHSKTEAISNGPCCLDLEPVTTCKCLMHGVL